MCVAENLVKFLFELDDFKERSKFCKIEDAHDAVFHSQEDKFSVEGSNFIHGIDEHADAGTVEVLKFFHINNDLDFSGSDFFVENCLNDVGIAEVKFALDSEDFYVVFDAFRHLHNIFSSHQMVPNFKCL